MFTLVGLLLVVALVEGYRVYGFYQDLKVSRDSLVSIKADLDLASLEEAPEEVIAKRERLEDAAERMSSAEGFVDSDPFLFVARHIPIIGKQADGVKTAVEAGGDAARTGVMASEVALAYAEFERNPDVTSIEQAVTFLQNQEDRMEQVQAGYQALVEAEADMPEGLWDPLGKAKRDLSDALGRLDGLVQGYGRAQALLPGLLGYDGSRSYLLLPQNDTELFPSGGLISSYGVITFDQGRLASVDIEYFGRLYERWQEISGGEYVEPPAPLKNYLKRDMSWALGEAGWYPDFPTTAGLAQDFVAKGGAAPPTDGTIAIDLQFIAAMLELVGPIAMPAYDLTVDSQNLTENALALARDSDYVPGEPHEAFLSRLAEALLQEIYEVPKDRWLDLLEILDRMGRERHLQLFFEDEGLQALSHEYGFDGAMKQPADGDYLMIADTSVRSTKLNLILEPRATVDVALSPDGYARSIVSYAVHNPFSQWAAGRDPETVSALMHDGIYGCYLRFYVGPEAHLSQITTNQEPASLEQFENRFGKTVVGSFFAVDPDTSGQTTMVYETDDVVVEEDDGRYRYRLYVQKQAGTAGTPLAFRPILPAGATLVEMTLDGEPIEGTKIDTDLRTDRVIEVIFTSK